MRNTVSERIELIMKEFDLNKNSFSKAIGLTNNVTIGNIVNNNREPGYQILSKIIQNFDSINANWLLTGEGKMLLSPKEYTNESDNTPMLREEETQYIYGKTTQNDPPTRSKNDTPTDPPTRNLGLPKVVTVTEDDRESTSFVPARSAAGYLNGYADSEYIENLPTIRIPNLGGGTHRAFEIVGHSMNPTLHNHAIGIGRWLESFDDIRDRRIYTVVTKSEGIVTKRILNRISDSGRLILISDNQNKRDYPNILLDASEVLEIWYLRGALSFEFPEPDILYNRVNDLEAKVTLLMDSFQKGTK